MEFFNARISGNVPACKTKSKSVFDMVEYFNAANSNNMNVLTLICKASNECLDGVRGRTEASHDP